MSKPRPKITIWIAFRDAEDLQLFAERAWVSTHEGAVSIEYDDYYRKQRITMIHPLDLIDNIEVKKPRGRLSDVGSRQ